MEKKKSPLNFGKKPPPANNLTTPLKDQSKNNTTGKIIMT